VSNVDTANHVFDSHAPAHQFTRAGEHLNHRIRSEPDFLCQDSQHCHRNGFTPAVHLMNDDVDAEFRNRADDLACHALGEFDRPTDGSRPEKLDDFCEPVRGEH